MVVTSRPAMLSQTLRLLPIAAVLAFAPMASAADKHHHDHDHGEHREHGVHVHGEGRLTLALSESRLDLALTLPADSAFGFEHAPQDTAQTATVDKVSTQLRDVSAWLGGISDCSSKESRLTDPFAGAAKGKDDSHRDLEGSWVLECSKNPTMLEVKLFGLLPRLKHLDVEWVTDTGAGAAEMVPGKQSLTLP